MDRDTMEKVFDPFFSTKFAGRGLGMSAVLGIVRGHKGALRFHSEPGGGTTFRILFPVQQQAAAMVKDTATAIPNEEEWNGAGVVLIADDEDVVLKVGKQMLERIGFDVLTATDGREALELYRAHQNEIACVLLDLTMPNLGGEQTFEELRRINADVKVILCSGYDEQDAAQRFSETGPAGFVQKPYKLAELRSKLQVAMMGDAEG